MRTAIYEMQELRSRYARYALGIAFGVALTAFAACTNSSTDGPPCVEVDLECKPLVDPPTFDAIHTQIIAKSCATGGKACHGAEGAKAGLVLEGVDTAYDALTRAGANGARANPDDIACSPLMTRLYTTDRSVVMPPGSSGLDEPARCAIAKWLSDGAKR